MVARDSSGATTPTGLWKAAADYAHLLCSGAEKIVAKHRFILRYRQDGAGVESKATYGRVRGCLGCGDQTLRREKRYEADGGVVQAGRDARIDGIEEAR